MAPVSRCDLRLPCTPKPKGAKSADGTAADEDAAGVIEGRVKSDAEGADATAGGAKPKMSDPNAAKRNRVGSGGSSSSAKAKLSDPTVGGGASSGSSTKGKSSDTSGIGAAKSKLSDPGTTSKPKKTAGEDPTGTGSSSVSAKYKGTGSSSVPSKYHKAVEPDMDTTKGMERMHKSQEFSEEMGVDTDTMKMSEDAEKVPESAHDEVTRDSAEVVEQDSEFRTALTRDSYEAEQHAGHEIGEQDPCEILRKCKEEVEAAIEAGECEIMQCPSLDRLGTPGDVCAQFCHDRLDSPKSVADLDVSSKKSKFCAKWSKKKGRVECDMRLGPRKRGKAEVVCKGTYKSDEVYVSLWGSSKAMDFRKRLESQMKKKRNLLEKMHRKEFLRRQKMRRRAKEKRRALKQRDPSKISNGDDNLRINKAYDLRVNYNKQLPMMPGTMQQHFDKFKKPPFKTYVTGQKVCTKRIDEFEKLRVPEKTTAMPTTAAPVKK